MWWSIISIVYRWSRYSICWTCATFKINNRRPLRLLINIIIITSRPKRNISSLLHRRLRHWAIVYVAVGVEGRLNFAVGRWMWIAVCMLLMVLWQSSDVVILRLRKFRCQLSDSFEVCITNCCIGPVDWFERTIIILQEGADIVLLTWPDWVAENIVLLLILYRSIQLNSLIIWPRGQHWFRLLVVVLVCLSHVGVEVSVQCSRLRILSVRMR